MNQHYIYRQYRIALAPAVYATLKQVAEESGLSISQCLDRLILIHAVPEGKRAAELARRRSIINKRLGAATAKLGELRACLHGCVDTLTDADVCDTVEGETHE